MREYIDEISKSNEIMMLLRHPSNFNKIVVILEGDTDIKLFRNFLDKNCLSESVDGKKNVKEVINILNTNNIEKVVAICDADFDHINNLEYDYNNIFLTDSHDAETMMINSPAITSLLSEYSLNNSIFNRLKAELLNIVLDICRNIGLLRLINYDKQLNLNFKCLNFDLFISEDDLDVEIDMDNLINQLITGSNNLKEGESYCSIFEYFRAYSNNEYDLFQICSGHDITRVISIILNQNSLSRENNINQKKVESALRLSYNMQHFIETDLYRNIACWETDNSMKVFELSGTS